MKKLIIILGVVLLSETDAFAASSKTMDWALHSFQTCNLTSCTSTQVASIKADRGNNPLTQQSSLNPVKLKRNLRFTVAEAVPPTRGNPDGRGSKPAGDASR